MRVFTVFFVANFGRLLIVYKTTDMEPARPDLIDAVTAIPVSEIFDDSLNNLALNQKKTRTWRLLSGQLTGKTNKWHARIK